MIDILLTTYNGEKFLRVQLDSLFNQTYQNFKILICDDKSTDKTKEILQSYKNKYFDKIEIIEAEKKLGHCYNFLNLISYSKSEYIMFCDQDDIWLPNKIELSLKEIKKYDYKNKPLLLHTEQLIIDELGKIINESSTKYFDKIIDFKSVEQVAFRGGLHGCTMMLNKKLLNYLKKEKIWKLEGMVYHDWSIAIIAKIVGEILYLEIPTMKYRIHGNNASLNNSKKEIFTLIKNSRERKINRQKIFNQYYCLKTLCTEYEEIIKFKEKKYIERIILNLKLGDWKFEKNYLKKILKIIEV